MPIARFEKPPIRIGKNEGLSARLEVNNCFFGGTVCYPTKHETFGIDPATISLGGLPLRAPIVPAETVEERVGAPGPHVPLCLGLLLGQSLNRSA